MSISDPPALTLLHISDLHFGQHIAAPSSKATAHFDQQMVTQGLLEDVTKLSNSGMKPDWILVTGDIAFSGQASEYALARTWLEQLTKAVGLGLERVMLVPGNHDGDRKKATGSFTAKTMHQGLRAAPIELNDLLLPDNASQLQTTLWPKLAAYADFAGDFGAPQLSPSSPFWTLRLATAFAHPVYAIGLNSCLLSYDGDDAPSNLALGLGQLERAFRDIPSGALVLAMAHHPPEWLVDDVAGQHKDVNAAYALTTFLQKHPHILFVGHVHQQGGLVTHPLHTGGLLRFVAGAGHEAAHEGGRHAYAWVRLHGEGIDFYPRMWNADRQCFQPEANRFTLEKGEEYARIRRVKLADPLEKWLEVPVPQSTDPGTSSARLPHPFVPPAWSTWARKEYDTLTPLIANQSPISFRLEKVYVEMYSSWWSPAEYEKARTARKEIEERHPNMLMAPPKEFWAPPRRALSELVNLPDAHHMALKGGPGSGKSTALRRLLQTLLDAQNPEPVLPIYLDLKDFGFWLAEHPNGGNDSEQFLAWAGSRLAKFELSVETLASRLGFGNVVWLLDGLDEILQDALRLRAAHILGAFIKHAPRRTQGAVDRLVITGRHHALEDARVICALGLEHRVAELDDLTYAERAEFLKKWFAEVYQHNAALALKHAQTLIAALPHHPEVNELSRTPLMLSTMAAVFQMGKVLPKRRTDLYHHAIDVMLQRRFGGPFCPGDYQQSQARRALSVASRELMLQGRVCSLGRTDFEQVLSTVFYPSGMTEEQRQKLESLAEWLGSQSGLLTLKGDPLRYTFSHLGLQEFLCAEWFASCPDQLKALGVKLDQESWREVILLTGGRLLMDGRGALGERFLEALLDAGADKTRRAARTELLAWIIAEAPKGALSKEQLPRIKQRCVEVISNTKLPSTFQQRVSICKALGKVGDPRLGLEKPENWIWIAPGEFRMGDDNGESNEKPSHPVKLSKGFDMSRFLVTNHDFKAFVEVGGYGHRQWWSEAGWQFCKKSNIREPGSWKDPWYKAPNLPVVGLSWYEAGAFCRWMTAKVRSETPANTASSIFRLPSEAEWEFAARGKLGREYPWGNSEPAPERANYCETSLGPSPVGAFPLGATPEGLLDMAGNVWEWVEDLYESNYTGTPRDGNPATICHISYRVVRGGSFHISEDWLPAATRNRCKVDRRSLVGFRIVRVLPANAP